MIEPEVKGHYQQLEKDLERLHRPAPPDPVFVQRIEASLSERAAAFTSPSAPRWSLWSSARRALTWGAIGLFLTLALAWGIQYLLPRPMAGKVSVPPGYQPALLFARQDDLWSLVLEDERSPERLTEGEALNWQMSTEGRTFVQSAWYRPPQASPDGSWIAFSRSGRDLFLLDLYDKTLQEAPALGAAHFDWSPDSRQLALVPDDTIGFRDLVLYNLQTGERKALLRVANDRNASLAGDIVWSPDGKQIAYELVDFTAQSSQIQRIEVTTGQVKPVAEVANQNRAGMRLCWTATGQVTVDDSGGVRCSLDLSIPNQRSRSPDGALRASLSPGESDDPGWTGPSVLTVSQVDTGEMVWQRAFDQNFKAVIWSPDGKQLYLDDAAGDSPIWRIPADNSSGAETWLEDAFLIDVFIRPAASPEQTAPASPETAQTTNTPAPAEAITPAPTKLTAGLNLDSAPEEIRRSIISPAWKTLWIQGQTTSISPTGEQQNIYYQAWLERDGAGRVLSTAPITGGLNFNLDITPRWIWTSDGQALTLFDVQTDQFDPSADEQRGSIHPLEPAGPLIEMLFPGYLAIRSEALHVVEVGEQAGRPALVADWAGFRLWIDAETGVLLRQQTRAEDGSLGQESAIQAIVYDPSLPKDLLGTENLAQVRFEPRPDREIWPKLPTSEPSSNLTGEGEVYFELSGEPPFQWRMAALLDGCLTSTAACPELQEIVERPRPQLFLNWSHSGQTAVYADTNFEQLWAFEATSRQWRVVVKDSYQMQLAWSQDDRRLAAVTVESDPNHMNLVWVDTENWSAHPIPALLKGNKSLFGWLDDSHLAVAVLPDSFKGGQPDWIAEYQPGLFQVDIDTGEFKLIQSQEEALYTPIFISPDGGSFLVVEVKGQGQLALTGLDLQAIHPLDISGSPLGWSPDGKWICFTGQDQSLYLARPEDGSVVETHLSKVIGIAWSPDSGYLLVQSGEAEANDQLWLVSTRGEVKEIMISALKESYTWFLLDWQ